ncbi:MAG TPA: hypothetical protein VI485_28740 [Vicinamibacterales bacterium]|nr:hypothetical protein [Vicinamibacterales bacterium]
MLDIQLTGLSRRASSREGLHLVGCAVPFEVKSQTSDRGDNVLRTLFARGAFNQATLDDAHLTRVDINHDHQALSLDAELSFVNRHAGLYFSLHLPPCAAVTQLTDARHQWRGVSLEWFDSAETSFIDWNSCARIVERITFVSWVSLIVGNDVTPRFSRTWFSEHSQDAVERTAQRDREVLAEDLGANYRDALPREFWAVPLQSSKLEALMRQRDPDREFYDVHAWGFGFNREIRIRS